MRYRLLGKTGLRVSALGFGAWGIGGAGWVGATRQDSLRALERAIELGVNFIDTARGYGDSERLVGEVVRRHSHEEIHVATKVSPMNGLFPAPDGIDPMQVFPGHHIRASLEQSLRASGLEVVDVLQLHVWNDQWLGAGDWLETVAELKVEGLTRFFGVSLNDLQPESVAHLVETGVADTIQVIYNIFHQQPEERLLPLCQKHDVGVIVRVPFDEGGLTGRITAATTFPPDDWRESYFAGDRRAEVEARVAALNDDLGITNDQTANVALRFTLSSPAVSTVIAGMRRPHHVELNAAAASRGPLSRHELATLKRHRWERNFYA
jgi:aryl-alcohol dehydrogenase-like predicted oxidoreductase